VAARDKVYCREVLASRAAAGLARSAVKGVLLGLGIVTAPARECWVERTDPGTWVCASLNV
jgi:hypothetical protein